MDSINKARLEEVVKEIEGFNMGHEERTMFTMKDLFERETQFPFLIENLLPRVGISALVGSSDVGKSSFLRQFAVAVAKGESQFAGLNLITQSQKVLYISTEDEADSLAVQIKIQQKAWGLNPEELSRITFLFDGDRLEEQLIGFLEENKVDLVLIDAFSDLYAGQMNIANEVRGFLNNYMKMARKYGTHFMFLHHIKKSSEKNPPSKHSSLGSQGFESKLRALVELRRDPFNPHLRHLCILKGNYSPDSMKFKSYEFDLDENMCFRETGNRVDFNELVEQAPGKQKSGKEDKLPAVIRLKDEGKTFEEIAELLNISKSTAQRWFTEAKEKSHPKTP